VLFALVAAACAGGPARDDPRYDNNRIYRGSVTDAATGKPIEGAVVVVAWHIRRTIGSMEGGTTGMDVVGFAEVLTDKDGRFEAGPLGSNYSVPMFYSKDESSFPKIAFFKPGYEPTYRNERSWDQERDHLSQPFNNPATASPRRSTGEREVQLFRYLTRPVSEARAINPIYQRMTAEEKIYGLLWNFASSLATTVADADYGGEPLSLAPAQGG